MAERTASYRPRDKRSVANVDRGFYQRVATAERAQADRFVIEARTGKAWPVRAGQVFRVTTVEGPQVADLNLWNLHDRREHLWSSRTRQLQAAHVSTFDRLWSTLPALRPLVTIIGDTVPKPAPDEAGGVHDLLGTRCDPYVTKLLAGIDYDFHCQSNITRAISAYGLDDADVHDPLNMFQATGMTANDEYFFTTSPARAADYLEFFAEIDLLVAVSNCPGGDLSLPMWGPDGQSDVPCRRLEISLWDVGQNALDGWSSPEPVQYTHKTTGG